MQKSRWYILTGISLAWIYHAVSYSTDSGCVRSSGYYKSSYVIMALMSWVAESALKNQVEKLFALTSKGLAIYLLSVEILNANPVWNSCNWIGLWLEICIIYWTFFFKIKL